MNDPSQMMNRGFGMWPPPPPVGPPGACPPVMEDPNPILFQAARPAFTDKRKINWKGKKPGSDMSGGFMPPPPLFDSQYKNRVKTRRFYPKRKHPYPHPHPRFVPFAPRNTSSFIIRSKKSGGITSHVSPCPVTPVVLPTPKFSPSHEFLVDMAKEEWGVDGYGSMSGLIRLRPDRETENEEIEEGSSGSDVEEHVEVERRLDHDLSRFEMVYPHDGLPGPGDEREGGHVAQLEEENIVLKNRLMYMESEVRELRQRLLALEASYRSERFGDVDQNFRDGDNDQEEHSINGNGEAEAVSEENDGGIICSEKSAGGCATPARD